MMIECEVKSGQTAESIENTREEGGEAVSKKTKTGTMRRFVRMG